jgi:hypothetical protein
VTAEGSFAETAEEVEGLKTPPPSPPISVQMIEKELKKVGPRISESNRE